MKNLVSLCALLHDVDDWKYASSPTATSQKRSVDFLKSHGASEGTIDTVALVLDRIGFKESLRSGNGGSPDGGCRSSSLSTAETVLHVVQDADRLDALGKLQSLL